MIIGIIGKKRSGKDTFADYVIENSKNKFEKYSFAKPVKEICRTAFLLNDDQLYGECKEDMDDKWGVTARTLMQVVGTDLFRVYLPKLIPEFKELGENLWVRHFELFKNANPDKNLLIPDVRFQNEIDTIKKMGGIIIQVTTTRIKYTDTHSSENSVLTGVNELITNNESLENYFTSVKSVMEKYKF